MTISLNRSVLGAGLLAAGIGAGLLGGHPTAAAAPSAAPSDGVDSGPAAASRGEASRPTSSTRATRFTAARRPAVAGRAGGEQTRAVPVGAPTSGSPTSATGALPGAPGPLRAAVLAAQAYIYGYPLMEYERVRALSTNLNTIVNRTSFASPEDLPDPYWGAIGGGKRPNVDTLYSIAQLDLGDGPVVLSVPDMGDRYYSFQITDPYTNVVGYIGSRTTGSAAGQYAFTWAGGPQVDVPGAQTITVADRSILLLGRTLAGDAADQQQAIALMNQYAISPSPGGLPVVIPQPPPGIGLLDAISAAMELNPPPARDAEQLAAMAQIGVGPGLRVADAGLGPLALLAADLAVKLTAALLPTLAEVRQLGAAFQNRGWAIPDPAIGDYGTDYLLRAGVAEIGLLANTPQEATYASGLLDANLTPLSGYNTYYLHFAPGQTPPADAFWSVTMYDGEGFLVPNPLKQYSVSSSRPEELVVRPDGSVDVILSPTDPGDPGANWLPSPPGPSNPYLRIYVPGPSVLDGTWIVPGLRWQWSITASAGVRPGR
ncbi:MAG: DUF1254 domain-containing protein [Mycobacterium sp.]